MDEVDSDIFLICKTLEGWSYTEVVNMPEYERKRWVRHCETYNEKMREDYEKQAKKAKSAKSAGRRRR
jgi:hypothetical protein